MNPFSEKARGNRVYRITFPLGEKVDFRLLPWRDFHNFQDAIFKGALPLYIIENMIWEQCVLDSPIKEEAFEMLAGLISTVAGVIMVLSGPGEAETFNTSMDLLRQQMDGLPDQIAMIVCRAYPGYVPEDLEKMDWPTLARRLAQAERILLSKNPPELAEPIRLLTGEEAEKAAKKAKGMVDPADLIKDMKSAPADLGLKGPPPDLSPRQAAQVEAIRKLKEQRQGGPKKRRR